MWKSFVLSSRNCSAKGTRNFIKTNIYNVPNKRLRRMTIYKYEKKKIQTKDIISLAADFLYFKHGAEKHISLFKIGR